MLRPSHAAESAIPLSPDDELGQLIRWSLRRSFGGADPSEECWGEILRRVHEEQARGAAPRNCGTMLRALAPVVQAVVAGTLVLTFAVGLNQDVVLPRQEGPSRSARIAGARLIRQDYPEDTLSGCRLERMEWEHLLSEAQNIPRFAESR
jgi:hypothetical protein